MNNTIKNIIEEYLNEKIISESLVSGGCIAQSQILKTLSGKKYFLKSHVNKPKIFQVEANGLNELRKPNCIKIPKVIILNDKFLLLECIEEGYRPKHFFSTFGKQLALMHRYSGNSFGFYEDNYIGSTPQLNIPHENEKQNWTEFYFNKRLLYQFKLAEKNGYGSDKLMKGFTLLENKIVDILSGSEEPPTLIHGDLWAGNFLCDQNGKPVLIDSAVYYGHREAELAMTKLFGGFSSDFYSAYNDTYPLKDGYDYRENIYTLYHVMNHLNIFGSSYYNQTVRLISYYL